MTHENAIILATGRAAYMESQFVLVLTTMGPGVSFGDIDMSKENTVGRQSET
jgi:hypothetical protein